MKPSVENGQASVLKPMHAKVQPSPKFCLLLHQSIPKPQKSSSTQTISGGVEISPSATLPDTTLNISSEIGNLDDAQGECISNCKHGIPAFAFLMLSMLWYHHRGQLAAANDVHNEDRVNEANTS